jgi:hypothetical protein
MLGAMADVPDDEITALLAEPLDRFVEVRAARVKELKAAGEPGVAKALAKVRKPQVLVWAVGELARRHPDEAAEAAEVAADLEEATTGGEGDIRALLTQFREAIASLMQRADALEADTSQVGLALRSVLGDADARDAWVGGRLLALPEQGGFGGPADLAGFATAPKPAPRSTATKRPSAKATSPAAKRGTTDKGDDGDDDARSRAEAERREREEAERRAEEEAARRRRQEAVDEAAEQLDAARGRREEAAAAVEALEARLADLQAELDEARTALEVAESGEEDAASRLGEAEHERDQAG